MYVLYLKISLRDRDPTSFCAQHLTAKHIITAAQIWISWDSEVIPRALPVVGTWEWRAQSSRTSCKMSLSQPCRAPPSFSPWPSHSLQHSQPFLPWLMSWPLGPIPLAFRDNAIGIVFLVKGNYSTDSDYFGEHLVCKWEDLWGMSCTEWTILKKLLTKLEIT